MNKLQARCSAALLACCVLPAVANEAPARAISVDLNSCAKPEWPQESLRLEQQGRVTLEFLVGLDGKVEQSRVLQSSGFTLLDLAAQDGLAKCRFTPPASVGRTEPTWTKMQYVWKLEGPSATERQAEVERNLLAAQQGDAAAQFKTAAYYLYGDNGKPKDAMEGIRWLRASAAQGYSQAQEGLAFQMTTGYYVPRDVAESMALLEKAAAQGSASAKFGLALALMSNKPAAADEQRARQLLAQAAAAGQLQAQSMLGALLMKDPAQLEEGLRWLQKAADKHERWAQYQLALAYEQGNGLPQDQVKALELYQRAAAGGNVLARKALERLQQP